MNKFKPTEVFEIFDFVQKAETKEERIAILKENNCLAIRDVLRARCSWRGRSSITSDCSGISQKASGHRRAPSLTRCFAS